MPIMFAALMGGIAWMLFTVEPVINTSSLNEFMGLTEIQASIVSMFSIAGLMIGYLAQAVDRISKAHDRLVDKVYGLEEH